MSLPKNARKIIVNSKEYRWKLGKLRRDDGMLYSWIYIELPSGKLEKFEECMGDIFRGVTHPITPDTIKNLIDSNNL